VIFFFGSQSDRCWSKLDPSPFSVVFHPPLKFPFRTFRPFESLEVTPPFFWNGHLLFISPDQEVGCKPDVFFYPTSAWPNQNQTVILSLRPPLCVLAFSHHKIHTIPFPEPIHGHNTVPKPPRAPASRPRLLKPFIQ